MQITDILTQMDGLKSVAQELGVSDTEAAHGADALIPAILGGLKKQAQGRPGENGLEGWLGDLGGGGLLEDVLSPAPTHVERGNDVLGQLFGSKDVSRAVAQNAALQSQLPADLLKKMLPMVAMLVTGLMAKGQGAAAGSPDSSTNHGLGHILGRALGSGGRGADASGGWTSMLDLDGDGNALDDIMRMAGKLMR